MLAFVSAVSSKSLTCLRFRLISVDQRAARLSLSACAVTVAKQIRKMAYPNVGLVKIPRFGSVRARHAELRYTNLMRRI
jgi:hypothetical protein